MSELPDETRAFRQRLLAGLLGFVLGLVALLIAVACVVAMLAREQGWGSAIHVGLHLAIWGFVGAMAIGWLAMTVTDRIHARLGWLRCSRCGGRLGPGFVACACDPELGAQLAHLKATQYRRRRHHVARYRKRIPSVVLAWLVLIPVTYLLQKTLGHGRQPSPADYVGGHILLSGLVAVVGALLIDVMKLFNIGKRLRPSAITFLALLAVWPCVGAVYMLCKILLS